MKIIVDCMSGDNAPYEIVKGALIGAKQHGTELILVGTKSEIESAAAKEKLSLDGVRIVENTGENLTMEDEPGSVLKEKNESSMALSIKLLKDGEGDALVCAGNTGALLTGSTLMLRRIKGVRRPALGAIIPLGSPTLLADSGAQAVCSPEDLIMFAHMGNLYMKNVMGIDNPKIALVNNGAEEHKGTPLQQETYKALKNDASLNFIGNIEGRDIPKGEADVIIADGFTGNVVLKMCEGAGWLVKSCLNRLFKRNLLSKIAYIFASGSIKQLSREMDYSVYGGAPFLGVAKPVIKAHGSANYVSVAACIGQAERYAQSGMIEDIAAMVQKSDTEN